MTPKSMASGSNSSSSSHSSSSNGKVSSQQGAGGTGRAPRSLTAPNRVGISCYFTIIFGQHGSPMKTAIFLATLAALLLSARAQNSCTAVAYLGQAPAGGGSCTGQELGDASMNGAGFGACDEVTNGACVLTESSEGDCVIHLYSDSSCATPITGGNTITCGDPFENVNFNSFQVECA
ncbi:hypothetical protein DFH08DRAFT_1028819 [Mycena albidolilacea]|uniref:Uncharacterized protein n=1 Tax=Mycena albidolilacea TaxID=1033008 RepID=A0AAD6ZJI9_9AGAR|nr:hypothetical protein DFH08DRAFT_1028819 [Mycena albidolilacea]